MERTKRILVLLENRLEFETARPAFSDLPLNWKVHFASTPNDALTQLGLHDFQMVFVELEGGPLEGIKFLDTVWSRQPNTFRFLVGDVIDPNLIVPCAMGMHQFMFKPLDRTSVEAARQRAGFMQSLLRDEKMQGLVSRFRTFPTRPSLYLEVMKEIRSAHPSIETIGEMVSKDLAISTKLIHLVNSAAFGLSQRAVTPVEAVVLVGLETTAALVLAIEAFSKLDQVKPAYFTIDQIWGHSQKVAQSARSIAMAMSAKLSIANDAFTAGLLHDLGKLLLTTNLDAEYRQAITFAHECDRLPWDVERELLGASHAETGAYLLGLWGLPLSIVEAVAGHHLPARKLPEDFSALTAVHLANALEAVKHSTRNGFPTPRFDAEYPAELKLTEKWPAIQKIVSADGPTGATTFLRREMVQRRRDELAASLAIANDGNTIRNWWNRLVSSRAN